MNCEEFKNQTLINMFGKQTPEQEIDFERHLQGCSNCAKIYSRMKSFSGLFEGEKEAPLPHWGKSWRIISERTFKKKKFSFEFTPQHKMVFAVAASAIIFLFGIFVGKQFFIKTPEIPIFKTSALNVEASPLTAYAESLELVLINFRNQKIDHSKNDYAKLQQKLISEMLAQTEILKYIYSQENNDQLVSLFEDIELILLNISNLRPGEKDMVVQLNKIIQRKAIVIQLQQFSKLNTKI